MGRARAVGATLLVACSALALPAWAEDDAATRAAARKLAEDGVAALQAGDAATATQKLDKAYRMLAVPSVALWSARALVKRGALIEAAERYRECARLPASGDTAVQDQAKADAQKELDELLPRIPALIIEVTGATPEAVTLDGQRVPPDLLGEERPVNPGPHRIVAKLGANEAVADVTVAEREKQRVPLKLNASAPAPAVAKPEPVSPPTESHGSARKYVGIGLLAAGGVGLAVGGVTGVLSMSKRSSLEDSERCNETQCDFSEQSGVESLRTLRTTSTIGFVAGGVLAAAGAVVLLTAPTASPSGRGASPSLALWVGPTRLSVKGSF